MRNLLLEGEVEYKVERTALGTWKAFMYPGGTVYREFTSHQRFRGLPLLHFTSGRCPETGRLRVARGVVAVGRVAVGVVALGQAAFGLVALGQASLGLLVGVGQLAFGVLAVGQAAVGLLLGAGQLAVGWIAAGQFAMGHTILAQLGVGTHAWLPRRADPEAVELFRRLFPL